MACSKGDDTYVRAVDEELTSQGVTQNAAFLIHSREEAGLTLFLGIHDFAFYLQREEWRLRVEQTENTSGEKCLFLRIS